MENIPNIRNKNSKINNNYFDVERNLEDSLKNGNISFF
jgi:hypothetical protein